MTRVRLPIARLQAAAKGRPEGWLPAVLAFGTVTGEVVEFDPEEYAFVLAEFGPLAGPRGLGDVVARLAQPIARGVDALAGTKLANCGGCARRQAALNDAFPFSPPHP